MARARVYIAGAIVSSTTPFVRILNTNCENSTLKMNGIFTSPLNWFREHTTTTREQKREMIGKAEKIGTYFMHIFTNKRE